MKSPRSPRSPRSLRSRAALGGIIVVAVLAALTTTAHARWIRGLSDVSVYGDDIAVCSSEVTLGFEIVHQFDSFDSQYPTFNKVTGEPYPGTNPQLLRLHGSEADALAQTNEVMSFLITIGYTGTSGGGYQFLGEQTLATPAGLGNGDVLYAYSFDFDLGAAVAVPLTIGDPVYDCPPEDLAWGVFSSDGTVRVNAFLPHAIIFNGNKVDPSTLVVHNGSVSSPVAYLFSFGPYGFAHIDMNSVDFACDTTSLLLTGQDTDGYEYEREISVTPSAATCGS